MAMGYRVKITYTTEVVWVKIIFVKRLRPMEKLWNFILGKLYEP